jgi:hypothetical protein
MPTLQAPSSQVTTSSASTTSASTTQPGVKVKVRNGGEGQSMLLLLCWSEGDGQSCFLTNKFHQ